MDALDSVSYDQYSNIPSTDELGIKTKIILSKECYLRLLKMISKTRNSNNETGAFFVGRKSKEDPFTIFIDYCTSEFACTNGHVSGGAAEPTDENYNELNQQISVCKNNGEMPIVFHFHTHPRQLHYESFSDQDLSLYAKMQLDNPGTSAFGMLGFPIPGGNMSNGLTIVHPVKPQRYGEIGCAEFYMYQNIYYCTGNEIYKMGQFDKKYEGRRHKQNLSLKIVRNSNSLTSQKKVCGIGLDPNTGQKIEDESVGYIDANGIMCFPSENVQFTFSDLSPRISNGVHK